MDELAHLNREENMTSIFRENDEFLILDSFLASSFIFNFVPLYIYRPWSLIVKKKKRKMNKS